MDSELVVPSQYSYGAESRNTAAVDKNKPPLLHAGISVTLVLIPKSVAYAGLAGCTALSGLYAAAVAPIPASVFASSRYLQVGPCALMSMQTLGALAAFHIEPGTALYTSYATLMCLLVSGMRLAIGLLRAGELANQVPHHVRPPRPPRAASTLEYMPFPAQCSPRMPLK